MRIKLRTAEERAARRKEIRALHRDHNLKKHKEWMAANRERVREKVRAWHARTKNTEEGRRRAKKNGECQAKRPAIRKVTNVRYYGRHREKILRRNRAAEIARDYGITVADVENMRVSQKGLCAICEMSLPLSRETHIDHCHETGKVRALLCSRCNMGLGHFRDDIKRLKAAVKYLQHHKKCEGK